MPVARFVLGVSILQKHSQRVGLNEPLAAHIPAQSENFGANTPGADKIVKRRTANGKLAAGLLWGKPLDGSGDELLGCGLFHRRLRLSPVN